MQSKQKLQDRSKPNPSIQTPFTNNHQYLFISLSSLSPIAMVPNPDIWSIRSESNRILECYRGHLFALSFIFLLPLSSLFLLYPTFYFQFLNHSQQHQPINPPTPLFFYLLYSLCVMFFSFCGVSSITYSVFHGFYGLPFNLLSSIKSIFTSFFPLLATTIVLKVIFFFISFFFALLLFLIILGTQLVGITVPYSSPYFIGLCVALVMLPLLFVVIHLQVKWTLVPVIVVLETCWGLEPLRRSASLMKGMKKVGLCLLFFFGFFEGMLVWGSPVLRLLVMGSHGIPKTFDWENVLLLIVGKSILLVIFLLLNIVVNTMLYISCKGIHCEHKERCGKEYVSVPLDDKVSLVVSELDV